MKSKVSIPLVLMIATILLVAAFQVYWLHMSVEEEKRNLRFRTNFLFRESVFELRSSKLKLDTSARFRYGLPPDISRFAEAIRKKISDNPDSLPLGNTGMNAIISIEKEGGLSIADSIPRGMYRSRGRFFEFLVGIDSLQDSLRLHEVVAAYAGALKKENLKLPFSVTRIEADTITQAKEGAPPEWNKVTIGFTHPVSYRLELGNTFGFLFMKLLPQVLFSLFLISLTITAFVILYKNLRAQQRLTDIKNEFISNITHELKTPISTVSVAIEAIKSFDVLQKPERAKEYLGIAGDELNRLSMLVDKVLKLSMFEKENTEIKQESFDLVQLAKDVIKSMGLQFEKARAQVYLQADVEQCNIVADKMHITSVLYNLLDNALKYSKTNPEIRVKLSSDERYCTLSVKDNGLGIDPAYKDKVFEKFFRVPTGDRHNIKGYGLGLSYVAHIVRQHNGHIHVESEAGKGSEFIIKLPSGMYEHN